MDIVNRIIVRFLQHSGVLRSNKPCRVAISLIEEGNGAVVGATDENVGVLGGKDKGAERRWS
jgi:hypothetical protein